MPARPSLARLAGLVALSLVEFRIFVLLHRENLYELAMAAREVIAGTPQWRAFQNRLLGPYAVAAWSSLTGQSYEVAHGLFLLVLTVAANLTAFAVFRRLSGSADTAFRYTIYFLMAFVALTADEWVFVWDFLEMPIFLLFAYGVFTARSWHYFLPLFLVALLNRESALFMAAWLIIDGLTRRASHVWIGAAMAAAGLAYTIGVRQAMFIRSSLGDVSGITDVPILGNQFNVVESARRAAIHLLNPALDMVFLVHAGYVFLGMYVAYHWRVIRREHLSKLVLVSAMLVAVPTFGFFNETRQYAYLVPMMLAFDLALRGKMAECDAQRP